MRNVTRTVYGIALQTARELGIPYQQGTNASLNEAVRLIPGYVSAMEPRDVDDPAGNIFNPTRDTQNMYLRYLSIGRGALAQKTATDGTVINVPVPHSTKDSGWYQPMPFALIRPGQPDLSSTERQNYRLRRTITVNGEECIAYYLRVLDYSSTEVVKQRYQLIDGNKTDPVDFQPSQTDLKPPLPALPENNVMPNNGTYYSASAPVDIVFNEVEIQRIVDAATAIAGYPEAAKISEWCFVSACDRTVQVPNGGLEYTDVLGAQVQSFLVSDDSLVGQTELRKSVNLGNAEPLYGIGNI